MDDRPTEDHWIAFMQRSKKLKHSQTHWRILFNLVSVLFSPLWHMSSLLFFLTAIIHIYQ